MNSPADLQKKAQDHLWMHFTRQSVLDTSGVPVIVRGEGHHIWDDRGKRYFDGLSGLFVVNAGHGRKRLAQAAAKQAEELAFFPLWSYAHPSAIELADRLADEAPGDLNRVFFTTGGGEAVETAFKLAKQFWKLQGQPLKHKVISRSIAYHGTPQGALAITGIPVMKAPFEPLVPGAFRVPNTNAYRAEEAGFVWDGEGDRLEAFGRWAADRIEEMILFEGPETVAAVFLEPVQNSGGCFPPPPGYFQRVREICDRHDVLLVSDEVICAYGRIGYTFACNAYDYVPDIITSAKGLTSGYAPLSACLLTPKVWDVLEADAEALGVFGHGFTYSGHPLCATAGLANLDVMESEGLFERAAELGVRLQGRLHELFADHPHVGDVRGMGLIGAVELVRDRQTKEAFAAEEKLGQRVFRRLLERGVIIRAIGDCLAFCPPYVIESAELDTVLERTRAVLDELTP